MVPAQLLELRYFIIPFLLLQLHIWPQQADGENMSYSPHWAFLAEGLVYILVDAVTCALFLLPLSLTEGQGKEHLMW